ncbi:MAG: hypothetical protein K2X52_30375, partial [Mycobacteriaceae bacterium]|nr:hypothetical protein [Mycobacteriaceae bacterium]
TIANGTLIPRRHSDKRTSRHAGVDHHLLLQTGTLGVTGRSPMAVPERPEFRRSEDRRPITIPSGRLWISPLVAAG